ncbi:tRNA-guanine transglycosylase [Spirosoma spitsbergense]|uniref:tRNA-guanine transglycosylase n=1 Tax=Spirosoma spitsbergense TaxID=431554 RepID=UPI00036F5DFD|nr:tRNA-guanine transglycosylase [Spirosoma spitsbergense]
MNNQKTRYINTAKGTINFPAYIPVTTFGEKYPLDQLIRPYLPRMSQCVMVSYYYAQYIKKNEHPRLPLMVDSGGFAALFESSVIQEQNGVGIIQVKEADNKVKVMHPLEILEFQESIADIAFTLDFPISPKAKKEEALFRQRLTIANALWAIKNRRRKEMKLYACVQAWDAESAKVCAQAYVNAGFDGIAIGGLVPRVRDLELIKSIIQAVREVIPDLPLHVFGIGKPGIVEQLFTWGVDSIDSSSYVQLAAEGKLWSQPDKILTDPTPLERMHLALCNLAYVTSKTLPLSVSEMFFSTTNLSRMLT